MLPCCVQIIIFDSGCGRCGAIVQKKEKAGRLPDGCTADMVKTESSVCTGEKTIGFYDKSTKRLMYAEVVRTAADIDAFYVRYGIEK